MSRRTAVPVSRLLLLPGVVAAGVALLVRPIARRRQRVVSIASAARWTAAELLTAPEHDPATGRAVAVARRVLIGLGVVGLLVAAWIGVTEIHPRQYLGVLLWLAAAVVLHDGILGPLVYGANRLLRGAGARIPAVVLAILQVAVVVGAIFTLVVVPELRAQQLGVRNPTVLPGDYALHLVVLWVVLAVLAAAACALAVSRRRRRLAPAR